MILENDIAMAACPHLRECPKGTCAAEIERRKHAQARHQKTVQEIYPERKPKPVNPTSTKLAPAKPVPKILMSTKGPSTLTSKSASAALSQRDSTKAAKLPIRTSVLTTKSRLPFSNISARKQTPPPTNPSEMRHTAATLASKTTIGRSAGRSVSATMRKTSAPTSKKIDSAPEMPDTSLPAQLYIDRYGEPERGSEMWTRCQDAGCFDNEPADIWGYNAYTIDDFLREEGEREFQLQY